MFAREDTSLKEKKNWHLGVFEAIFIKIYLNLKHYNLCLMSECIKRPRMMNMQGL